MSLLLVPPAPFPFQCLLQEIDAITTQHHQTDDSTPSAPAPSPSCPELKTEPQAHVQNGSTQEFQYNTQYSLAGGGFSGVLFSVKSMFSLFVVA